MHLLEYAVALLLPASATAASLGSEHVNNLFGRGASQGVCMNEQYQPAWYKRNLATVRAIYDLTVYPNNLPILAKGGKAVPPGLFSQHATGRVSPVGDFEGFEDSIEYFFALAPVPQGNSAGTAFYDAAVVDFVSACPEVAASLVYFRTGSVSATGYLNKSAPTSTLSQVAFWRFDDAGAVLDYQAWVPNLQAWTLASSGIDYSNMTIQEGAAQKLCPVIQQRCTGKDQQYSSVEDCGKQLAEKPFGNFDEAWGDNIACRTIHLILTMVRPDIHCPHVGPTGGGKCVNIDYSVDYFDDANLYKSPLGSIFTCSGPLQPDNQFGPGPDAAKILQGLAASQGKGAPPGGSVGAGQQQKAGAGVKPQAFGEYVKSAAGKRMPAAAPKGGAAAYGPPA